MVTTSYIDTSAAMKLIVNEVETGEMRSWWGSAKSDIAASWLIHTELHCAAGRRPETLTHELIGTVLDAVILVDISRGDLLAAGTHTPLRSNDAIHLATALRIGAQEIVTYDHELGEAAQRAGLIVVAPA